MVLLWPPATRIIASFLARSPLAKRQVDVRRIWERAPNHRPLSLIVLTLLLVAASATAQSGGSASTASAGSASAAALAKQLSNPVASLVSVPLQANWEFGVGPERDTRFLVNVQPVMPFSLNERWNLIARVIVPIVNQPILVPGGEPTSGVSDITFSTFLSPAEPKGAVWGVGPVFLLPTTSDPFLGTETELR